MNLNTIGEILRFYRENITLNRAMFVMEYVHLWRKYEKQKIFLKINNY